MIYSPYRTSFIVSITNSHFTHQQFFWLLWLIAWLWPQTSEAYKRDSPTQTHEKAAESTVIYNFWGWHDSRNQQGVGGRGGEEWMNGLNGANKFTVLLYMLLSTLPLPILPMGQYHWDCKIDKRKSETYKSHTVRHQIKTGAGFYFPYYTPFGVSWPWEYISFKIILYPEVVEVYLIKISFHSAKSLDISPIYGIRTGKHAWESTVKSSIEEKNNT